MNSCSEAHASIASKPDTRLMNAKKKNKPWRNDAGPSNRQKKETLKYTLQKCSAKETFTHIQKLLAKDAKELKYLMIGAQYDETKDRKAKGNIMDKVEDLKWRTRSMLDSPLLCIQFVFPAMIENKSGFPTILAEFPRESLEMAWKWLSIWESRGIP